MVLTLTAVSLLAQTTASLTGVATSSNEPLAGVTVTIASPSLQGERTTLTADNGAYRFAALPPGEYTIRFEASGMHERIERARLQLAQTTRVDAMLIPVHIETMTVHGAPPPELATPAVV